MKTLAMLPIVFTVATFKDISSLEFLVKDAEKKAPVKQKAILVKPKIHHQPMAWVSMVEGVKYFEGYYAKPYVCGGGKRTIGFGHTGKYVSRGYVSKQQAHDILQKDLEKAKAYVLKYVTVPLNDGQLACLTSFTFNCGQGSLRKMVNGKDRLNSGNYKSVEKILPLYRRANGKILKGLVKRRSWELELWNDDSNTYYVKN